MVMGSCLLMPGPWLRGYENNLFAFLFCAIRKGRSVSRWCWLFTCDVLPGKIKCRVTSTLSSSLQECFQHTPFKVQSSTGCDFALLHHTFLQWSRWRKGESCPGLVCPSGEALTRPGPLSWPAPSQATRPNIRGDGLLGCPLPGFGVTLSISHPVLPGWPRLIGWLGQWRLDGLSSPISCLRFPPSAKQFQKA